MPQETTKHTAVLEALKSVEAIADLAALYEGHYAYEVDLEVTVYGRNYNGKNVGPYVRLLTYDPGEEIIREGEWGGNNFFFVVQGLAEVYVQREEGQIKVAELPAGAQFGEMSLLAGGTHAATVRAPLGEQVQVIEVSRPALRLLRKLPKFGEVLDNAYHRYGRAITLQALGKAAHLSNASIKQLRSVSQFRVYSKRHVLFRAGQSIDRIYVLKSGWVRLSRGTQVLSVDGEESQNWDKAAGERYVGPSHCFGLEAVTRESEWSQTGVSLGRTEVLEISISKLRQRPELREPLMAALHPLMVTPSDAQQRPPLPVATAQRHLIDTGLVDGTNLLIMDMDLCVRCGNCSMACHKVHGQSRLLRRGIHITRPVSLARETGFQSLLHPSVCMHCQDPECLTGCPTGAIGRFGDGQVGIDPQTCIGCGDCATQCPYDAISLVPRKPKKEDVGVGALRRRLLKLRGLAPDRSPSPVEARGEGVDDLVAVKCNLCAGTGLNPAGAKTPAYSCEENCPTGALLRVDPHTYFAEIKQIEGLVFKDATHAIARHFSHHDRGKQLMHVIGVTATVALTLLTVVGITRYKFDVPLFGGWLNMRWLTGLAGLVGMAGGMTYPVRRQIYRRRVGPLRYWMLAHTYLGVVTGSVLLLHGGTRSGGALTTALTISLDLGILTGLFGVLSYFLAPRLLTKIEGQPLLIDDLTTRRQDLGDEIRAALTAGSRQVRELIERIVLPRFLSFGYLMRQYLGRESLESVKESARNEFKSEADALPAADRDGFLQVVELAAISRRVDALVYLHHLLKLWVAPHVLAISIMLALMLVHIIQVIYFAVR
jgi:Fe-S-cluster-containing dehydrogenase component/CRP-like cAMP-binding protein